MARASLEFGVGFLPLGNLLKFVVADALPTLPVGLDHFTGEVRLKGHSEAAIDAGNAMASIVKWSTGVDRDRLIGGAERAEKMLARGYTTPKYFRAVSAFQRAAKVASAAGGVANLLNGLTYAHDLYECMSAK